MLQAVAMVMGGNTSCSFDAVKGKGRGVFFKPHHLGL